MALETDIMENVRSWLERLEKVCTLELEGFFLFFLDLEMVMFGSLLGLDVKTLRWAVL